MYDGSDDGNGDDDDEEHDIVCMMMLFVSDGDIGHVDNVVCAVIVVMAMERMM